MRRAGFTNAIVNPRTWTHNNVIGATDLNPYLRDNILAIDNKITPVGQDIISYTPSASVYGSMGIVAIGGPASPVNMLALSEYSPNIALSIDFRTSFSNLTASVVWFEAIVEIENSHFRYRMFKVPEYYDPLSTKEPLIGATNYISGAHLGNTDYGFWSGFVRNDMLGNNPFALTGELYDPRVTIVVGATGGNVELLNPTWALRFRANVAATVQNPSTNYNPDVGIYGQSAF